MTVPVDDPEHGAIHVQGITPKLSATPGAVSAPAPTLGQHNTKVFTGLLGLTEFQPVARYAQPIVAVLGALSSGFLAASRRAVFEQQESMKL